MGMSTRSPSTTSSRRHVAGVDLFGRGHGAEAAKPQVTPRPSVSNRRTRKPVGLDGFFAVHRGLLAPGYSLSFDRHLQGERCFPVRGQHVAAVEMEEPAGRASAAEADRARPAAARETRAPRPSDAARRCRCPAGTIGPSRLARPAACRASAARTGDGRAARRRATSSAACRGEMSTKCGDSNCVNSVGRLAMFDAAIAAWRFRLSRRIGRHSTNPTGWGRAGDRCPTRSRARSCGCRATGGSSAGTRPRGGPRGPPGGRGRRSRPAPGRREVTAIRRPP